MATTALTAGTNLLDRVRNPNGEGLSTIFPPTLASGKAFAYSILSQAQRYINNLEKNFLSAINYTLTASQSCYHIDSDASLGTGGTNPIIKPIGIYDGHRDLIYTPFQQLWMSDFSWFRRTADRPSAWSMYGRDVLIIYPAPARSLVISIIAVPYIADLTLDTDTFSVTDSIIPQVMDLAETLALFKMGEYKLAEIPLQRLSERYKKDLGGDKWQKQLSSLQ